MFLKLAAILGVEDNYPELQMKPAFAQVPNLVITDAVSPLKPAMDGDVKVFRPHHRRDGVEHRRAAAVRGRVGLQRAVARAHDPRQPRATSCGSIFKNNLPETTGVHFHGVEFADFFQDGVPFVTQLPITPGEEYAYDFVAEPARAR